MVAGTFFIKKNLYFFLPETKAKSLEEIGVLFEDQVHEEEEGDNNKMLLCYKKLFTFSLKRLYFRFG